MVPKLIKLASRLKQENNNGPLSPPPPAPPSYPLPPIRNKIQILEKHRKEFCEKVAFSHISHHLLTSEYLSKDDAYEICLLPLPQQMALCHKKVIDALSGPIREGRADLWTILLRALNVLHSGLTVKLDTDLHKLSKREKPSRLRKEDIGAPQEFKHIKHIGHTPTATPPSSYSSKSNPFRRFFSLRSTTTPTSTTTSIASVAAVASLVNNTSSPSLPGQEPYSSTSSSTIQKDAELVKEFFQKAGVTDFHLSKPGSRKLILDFIEKNGGMDAIRKEILRQEGLEDGGETGGGDTNNVIAQTDKEGLSLDGNNILTKL